MGVGGAIGRAWVRLSRLGVRADTSPRDARYVVVVNQAALLVTAINLVGMLRLLDFPSPVFPLVNLAQSGVYLAVPALHHLGLRRVALLLFAATSVASLTLLGVLCGAASDAHLPLLVVAASAFLFPSRAEPAVGWAVAFAAAAGLVLAEVLGRAWSPWVLLEPALAREMALAQRISCWALLVGFGYYANRQAVLAEDRLEDERARSDGLLLNVLPARIADRLKREGAVQPERFDEATVLFADLVDFTPLSERLAPQELVGLLDRVFTCFDALADAHGLEKIKTIGDAYLVVGGVPEARPDHCEAVARMALDMMAALPDALGAEGAGVRLRIGIATGPVVAGVIGRRKFAYDLWGDTVNTASRMESHGVPGRIQVTRAVVERLSPAFTFEGRGAIPVKGKGTMESAFLLGPAATRA